MTAEGEPVETSPLKWRMCNDHLFFLEDTWKTGRKAFYMTSLVLFPICDLIGFTEYMLRICAMSDVDHVFVLGRTRMLDVGCWVLNCCTFSLEQPSDRQSSDQL